MHWQWRRIVFDKEAIWHDLFDEGALVLEAYDFLARFTIEGASGPQPFSNYQPMYLSMMHRSII